MGLGVPRHLPVADLHVVHERAGEIGVAPRPAEAGGEAGGVASIGLRADLGVQLLHRIDDPEVEALTAVSDGVRCLVEAKRVVDPSD